MLAHVAEDAGVALAVALDARLLGPDVDVQADPDAEADGAVDEPELAGEVVPLDAASPPVKGEYALDGFAFGVARIATPNAFPSKLDGFPFGVGLWGPFWTVFRLVWASPPHETQFRLSQTALRLVWFEIPRETEGRPDAPSKGTRTDITPPEKCVT